MKSLSRLAVSLLIIGLVAAPQQTAGQSQLLPEANYGLQRRPILGVVHGGIAPAWQEIAGAGADTTRQVVPGKALLRSALLPGWGQFYVGRPFKGALVAGAAIYSVALTIRADGEVKDLVALRGTGGALTGAALEAEIELWRIERRRWLLWSLGAWLYGMIDAYVDAHLLYFEEDEPDFTLAVDGDGGGSHRLWLQLGIPLEGAAKKKAGR